MVTIFVINPELPVSYMLWRCEWRVRSCTQSNAWHDHPVPLHAMSAKLPPTYVIKPSASLPEHAMML